MSLPRLTHVTHIGDQLNLLAAMVKTRSRASLTDANRILETISTLLFNALFHWELENLNALHANYPAADLGDRKRRIAIQVTNEDGSDKIAHTAAKATEHNLRQDFDRLIVFFLLQKKPGFPRKFVQPDGGPAIETWDIADLLKQLQELSDLETLANAANILDEELGKTAGRVQKQKFDISRIIKYAPAELIGRDDELTLLTNAWNKVANQADTQSPEEKKRPHILTFVALGGEGKTSLVAKWLAELAHQDWPGCDAAFAWSFYSQGTREQLAASSDLFLKEALTFFGDAAMASSAQGAFEKGRRLAQLVGERRALLILDGLEPLQYAPTAPTPGELKDQGIAALLKGLASVSHGLCVVTTRYSLPDLKVFWQTTAPEVKLLRLSRDAGVNLLKSFNLLGTDRKNIPFNNGNEMLSEFEKLVEDVKGHALTLNLLGSYLRDAQGGDIRKRDLINFADADAANEHRHHVVHVMDAYARWLSPSGFRAWIRRLFSQQERETQVEGKKALAVLRLVGLFDRPVTDDCFGALLKAPAISNLTEPLVELNEAQRSTVLKRLEAAKLLTVNRDASGALISLDAHPHLREYFARQLRTQQPDAWRAAHRRLYEHLCATTPDKPQPTLEDLQPLYQAVAHGCQAGLHRKAREEVHNTRISHGDAYYSLHKLGAFGSDLAAVASFYDQPWRIVNAAFKADEKALLLGETAFILRALGRLTESFEPLRAALEMGVKQKNWKNASIRASNLSDLELTLGEVAGAVGDAEQSVTYADRSGDAIQRIGKRTRLADALHQAGRRAEAETRFREAEQMQVEDQPGYPLLYSQQGFMYGDLLLAASNRAAWTAMLKAEGQRLKEDELVAPCRAVFERAAQTLKWAQGDSGTALLDVALDHLTLGRAALYAAMLERSEAFTPLQGPSEYAAPNDDEPRNGVKGALQTARRELDAAVAGLRRASVTHVPGGLLTRAWLRFLTGARTGPDSAQEDLDEAWEIAERGPMKLFLADIHLYRARLFGRPRPKGADQNSEVTEEKYPWESPAADLDAAEDLIKKCGYHRRDEELADAKAALQEWEQR